MKIFLLIYLIFAVAVIVFCISAIIKGIMTERHKYRIKKVTIGTKDEYYIQKHFLFFWYTCQELQWAGGYEEYCYYEEVCFDTLEEAKKYIEKQKEKIDKKTEYIYY